MGETRPDGSPVAEGAAWKSGRRGGGLGARTVEMRPRAISGRNPAAPSASDQLSSPHGVGGRGFAPANPQGAHVRREDVVTRTSTRAERLHEHGGECEVLPGFRFDLHGVGLTGEERAGFTLAGRDREDRAAGVLGVRARVAVLSQRLETRSIIGGAGHEEFRSGVDDDGHTRCEWCRCPGPGRDALDDSGRIAVFGKRLEAVAAVCHSCIEQGTTRIVYGTEIDQTPGTGVDQAPRQAGPDTGADDPDSSIRLVDSHAVADYVEVTITPQS